MKSNRTGNTFFTEFGPPQRVQYGYTGVSMHNRYDLPRATSLSTNDFSSLYTTLLHNLIKEKLLDLIERTFYKKEGKLYLACNYKKAFFTSADHYRGCHLWSCQNICDALSFLLDNIYIRFGTKLYRQIVGIPWYKLCSSCS